MEPWLAIFSRSVNQSSLSRSIISHETENFRELFLQIFSILTTPLILHFQEQNKILFKYKIIFNIQVMSSSCLSEGKLMIYLLDNLIDLIKDSQVANIECFQLNDSHLYSRSAMNGGHFQIINICYINILTVSKNAETTVK